MSIRPDLGRQEDLMRRAGHIEGWMVASVCVLVLFAAIGAHGQATMTLTLSAQVQPSISLVFNNYPGACSLSNAGTNNVGLYLGWGHAAVPGATRWLRPIHGDRRIDLPVEQRALSGGGYLQFTEHAI
jgi:hypothetical protein